MGMPPGQDERRPEGTSDALAQVTRAVRVVVESLRLGGTLFVAGNGGSFADALHVAGELGKAFERPRPLPAPLRERLRGQPGGADLADHLQQGLRTIVLGANPVLTSAVDNDLALRHLALAQELCGLAREGDVLLAISTSGASPNLVHAAVVARALGAAVLVLTGSGDGGLAGLADVVIHAPGASTAEIQCSHVELYHALCRMVEAELFPAAPAAD